jgi:hypothetical protein
MWIYAPKYTFDYTFDYESFGLKLFDWLVMEIFMFVLESDERLGVVWESFGNSNTQPC